MESLPRLLMYAHFCTQTHAWYSWVMPAIHAECWTAYTCYITDQGVRTDTKRASVHLLKFTKVYLSKLPRILHQNNRRGAQSYNSISVQDAKTIKPITMLQAEPCIPECFIT